MRSGLSKTSRSKPHNPLFSDATTAAESVTYEKGSEVVANHILYGF